MNKPDAKFYLQKETRISLQRCHDMACKANEKEHLPKPKDSGKFVHIEKLKNPF